MTTIYTLVALMLALLILTFNIRAGQKKVSEDWKQYDDLEKQVKAVSTKEEANSLYIKIAKFRTKLNNSIIEAKIEQLFAFLDGFLKAKENE